MKNNIPKEILDRVHNALASDPVAANTGHAAEIACDAFADAMAEHPIKPPIEEMISLAEYVKKCNGYGINITAASTVLTVIECQRRIFKRSKPDVPDAVKDLMAKWGHRFDEAILEAYRIAKEEAK